MYIYIYISLSFEVATDDWDDMRDPCPHITIETTQSPARNAGAGKRGKPSGFEEFITRMSNTVYIPSNTFLKLLLNLY